MALRVLRWLSGREEATAFPRQKTTPQRQGRREREARIAGIVERVQVEDRELLERLSR